MTILFDLDGTLVDTAPDFIHALNAVRAEINMPPLVASNQTSIRMVEVAVTEGLAGLVEAGLGIKVNQPESPLLQKRLLHAYQQNLGLYATLFPGIEALLQMLEQRQIPWGVVTNKSTQQTHPLMERLGLSHRAACIVSGDTTPHSKPHPEPLFYACHQIGVSPTECIYIGDAERDIIAGNAAGMTTIAALFGYIEDITLAKGWGAHHYIHHADEILPYFEAWQRLRDAHEIPSSFEQDIV
ncbi:MAG TPA: HAD-IA family hydrolase [Gammaproteobacteria bacterium]|nr:HAD-IA family hydrolase [Gammaproteobacteria bacterium]